MSLGEVGGGDPSLAGELWVECEQPTADEQGQKKEKEDTLEYKRMAQAVEWLASQDLSKNQSAEQSEKVSTQVCPFTGAA